VIHGDFRPAAVVLDGSRPGFPADGLARFGHCRYDLRALDLAGALETFARAAAGGFDLDRCAEMMSAYDEVDRLAPAEVAALPTILRLQGLVRVFRLASRATGGPVAGVVDAIDEHAAHLRWLERHEVAFVEALASSCVG
jgi:Ser/Thr protein kinase RdoA (MazF antagonist)